MDNPGYSRELKEIQGCFRVLLGTEGYSRYLKALLKTRRPRRPRHLSACYIFLLVVVEVVVDDNCDHEDHKRCEEGEQAEDVIGILLAVR